MKIKSRKEIRKELRKAKKIQKHEFFKRRKVVAKQGNNNQTKSSKNESEKRNELNKKKIVERKKHSSNKGKFIKSEKRKEFKNPHEKFEFIRQRELKEKEKLLKDIEETRRERLKSDNIKEEMEIKKLEKQLKMKKGKSKALVLDGLDYILDICDKKISENEFEKTLQESDSEFDSDLENVVGKPKDTVHKKEKLSKSISDKSIRDSECSDNDESSIDFNEEENYSNTDDNDDNDDDDDYDDYESNLNSTADELDEDNSSEKSYKEKQYDTVNKAEKFAKRNKKHNSEFSENEKVQPKSKKVKFEEMVDDSSPSAHSEEDTALDDTQCTNIKSAEQNQMWEDIYGRMRDKTGNVIQTYVPPQKRKLLENSDNSKNEKLGKLRKQLKGLLNRLAESNMVYISNQVEQLYMANSRNDMNETLCNLFQDSLFTDILTPERLITEHAMLIAVLHANIGSEIGAHFLQYTVLKFIKVLECDLSVDNKELNNLLTFILHLYNFQLFHSNLMYDIITKLIENLEEKQIELLLLTLRTVGFNLRKDDPVALKSFILKVQELVNKASIGEISSRVKFMLEILMAIKNNNVSKIPNYNPEFVENLRKSLKIFIRKGNYSTELKISLQDLLNAEKHGRWWIVGSAWSGAAPSQSNTELSKDVENLPATEFSENLLKLARKQRMNTDTRKNIFCILMSSEDFLDAFEKLIKLKLKGSVEREIMNVLLHCALQEKNFNPYYMYLANKFCTFDRKYQIMLQCSLWDKIREVSNLLQIQITNLAKFTGNIILERGLPISVLKVIQFSDLDKPTIKFMRQVLMTILISDDRNAAIAVFKRISNSPKLKLFRESLRLFLQHFVLKNTKNVEKKEVSRLIDMVKIAEKTLTSFDGGTEF